MSNLQEKPHDSSLSPWVLSNDAILFVIIWASLFLLSELGNLIVPSRQNDVTLVINLFHFLTAPVITPFLLLALGMYIGADLWLSGRLQFLIKGGIVWFSILSFVILPTLAAIATRHNTLPYLYVHDGAIQIEEAANFLLQGKNPYVENYATTPMASWPFHEPGVGVNPALYHLTYMPLLPLISAPLYALLRTTLGWYDERLLYVPLLVLSGILAMRTSRTSGRALAALMVVTLNPLVVPFFVEGRNDIVISFFLLGAVVLFQAGRIGWAAVFVVLAAVTKQTAWFLIPFFLIHAYRRRAPATANRGNLMTVGARLLPAGLLAVAFILPFLLLNAPAFLGDILGYPTAVDGAGGAYPIKSLGLGDLALGLGWVSSTTAAFPFLPLGLAAGGIMMVPLVRRQWRSPTLAQLLMNYGLLLSVVSFFSRAFNDNHLGYALTWLLLPSFVDEELPGGEIGAGS